MNFRVTLFAWKNGYAVVEQVGVWNGYAVYQPKYTAEKGMSTYILVNDDEVRFAEANEAVACLNGVLAN